MGWRGTEGSSVGHPSNIFISYRRDDTSGHAGRLYDRLCARFGADRIFMDVDKIGPGVDFVEKIEEAVRSSRVLLALIGRDWLAAAEPGGQNRLHDPQDFVRLEISTALERDLLVIPLLVQGARQPRLDELPEPLLPLLRRNSLELSNERFDYDVARLTEAIEEALVERVVPAMEERKLVTVLMCDLVSAAAPEKADPEDVRVMLRSYQALIRREVERFGGTVETSIGDAVLAVFGAPVAHEDDPERGVRAGLRILEALSELNQDRGRSFGVRIGIDAGEALVSLGPHTEEGESSVTGDVVNTALYLQAQAPSGAVVVGEAAYQVTKHRFDYEELPSAGALPAWRALSPRSRSQVATARPTTPFIGREQDVALLKAAYGKVLRESSVQLVTVTGEPGVGKSRLVEEFFTFIDELPEITYWRQGRCLPYGEGITFWALGEIVKAHAGILESDGAEQAQAKLAGSVEALVAGPDDREWLKARLGPLVGLEAPSRPAERDESFTAWRRYLEAVAVDHPLVVVFEDLHWADTALLDFVEHLAEYASGVPIMVVATARPELYERRPGWGGGMRNVTTVSLGPLTDRECAGLISALLDRAVLPDEVQRELLARAGGNPLYAEEFVRMLSDRDLIKVEGREVEMARLEGLEVPANVQALIAARLDTISLQRKALLQDASVIGRVFWSGAVASMGGREEKTVRSDLHELVRKEMVREARTSSVEGALEYVFWHSLVREVCYGQIPRAQRGRKHQAAARWIEALAGERVADHAEFLAHHYRQALDLARASGATEEVEELAKASLRFLAMAGERAMALDVVRAESHNRAALELAPPGHPARGPILTNLGEALFMAGQFDGSEAAYTEAVPELRSAERWLEAGEAMRVLSRLLGYRGEVTRSRRTLAEALQILEEQPPGRELVRALNDFTFDLCLAGRGTEGLVAAERAVQLARDLRLEVEEVPALGRRGTALHTLGDPKGLEDFRTALAQALALGLGRDTAILYNNLAEAVWPAEGPRQALEVYRAGIAFAETRGMVLDAYTNRSSSLGAMLQVGDWDEALAVSGDVVDWLQGHGASPVEAAVWRAHGLLGRGEWTQAEAILKMCLGPARDLGNLEKLLPALAAAALLDRGRGDLPASLRFVQEFHEAASAQGTWYRVQFLPALVRICREAGDVALGTALLEGVADTLPGYRVALMAARAALAEARKEFAEALRLYAEAAEAHEGYGWVVEQGQALLGRGRCLAAEGRPGEAASSLRQAGRVFARLGAGPMVAESEALLQEGTALSS